MTTPGQVYPRGQTFQASASWVGIGAQTNEQNSTVTLLLVGPDGTSTDLTSQLTVTKDAGTHSVSAAVVHTIDPADKLGTYHLHFTCAATGAGGIAGTYHEWYVARLP